MKHYVIRQTESSFAPSITELDVRGSSSYTKEVKSKLLNLLLIASSIGIGLAAGEGILRFTYPVDEYKMNRQTSYNPPYIDYHNKYRYPKEHPKNENKFRVIVIGDSFTHGGVGNLENSYPIQLEAMLQKKIDKKIEVFNLGSSGSNARDYVSMLEEYIPKFNPDYLILTFSASDNFFGRFSLHPFLYCSEFGTFNKILGKITLKSRLAYFIYDNYFRHNLMSLYQQKESLKGPIGEHNSCFASSLKKINEILENSNIPHKVFFHLDRHKNSDLCRSWYSDKKRYLDVFSFLFEKEYFEITELFESANCEQESKYFADDSYHYNKQGYSLWAKKIFSHVKSDIKANK